MSRVLTIDREDGKRDLFGYNFAGELTSAKYGLVNGINPTRSVSYALDEAGNRESVTDGGTTNYTTDTINRYTLVGASGVVAGPSHQIGAFQANSYQYVGDSYLASVTAGSATYTLGYDALGRCVKRTLNGVTTYYVYDGARPIVEYKSTGALAGTNLYGKGIDEVLMRGDYVVTPGGQGYFYQQNYLGSVTHLTGWAGEVVEKYSYDAFGTPTTTYSVGVFNNRFKFTGREHQPTFGIYEYRNRAYHPGLGRFLSEDPIGFSAGDTNLFRYCAGDPVNYTDPSGLDPVPITKQTLNGTGFEITTGPIEIFGNPIGIFRGDIPDYANGSVLTNAIDWGSFGGIMHYLGGGDHGRSGLAGDGPLGGGISLGPPLPPSPAPIPNRKDPYYPYIPINPYNKQPLIFPSTVNPRALIAAAQQANRSWNPFALPNQILALRPGGPLDKQLKLANPIYENAGNWVFGAEGAAMGLPLNVLLFIGGVTNHAPGTGAYGDDPEDTFMIRMGFDYGR